MTGLSTKEGVGSSSKNRCSDFAAHRFLLDLHLDLDLLLSAHVGSLEGDYFIPF
jgi:hypothetical protein